MKFLHFSDFHHYPGVFMRGGFEDLDLILKAAEENKVDFIIHADDLTHGPDKDIEFVNKYNDFHILTYNCLGNCVTYTSPICGIITVNGTTVTCKETESELFMGVTREMTGNPKCDKAGRIVRSRNQADLQENPVRYPHFFHEQTDNG